MCVYIGDVISLTDGAPVETSVAGSAGMHSNNILDKQKKAFKEVWGNIIAIT